MAGLEEDLRALVSVRLISLSVLSVDIVAEHSLIVRSQAEHDH